MRTGVINWDCSLPPDTFFGSYIAKTLGDKNGVIVHHTMQI